MNKRRILSVLGLLAVSAATVAGTRALVGQQVRKPAPRAANAAPKADPVPPNQNLAAIYPILSSSGVNQSRPHTEQELKLRLAEASKRAVAESVPEHLSPSDRFLVIPRGGWAVADGHAVKVHADVRMADATDRRYLWSISAKRRGDGAVVVARQYDDQLFTLNDTLVRNLTFDETLTLPPGTYDVAVKLHQLMPTSRDATVPRESWNRDKGVIAGAYPVVVVAD